MFQSFQFSFQMAWLEVVKMIYTSESVVDSLATNSARKEGIHNKQDQGYDILEKFSILSEQNQMFLSVELIGSQSFMLVICTKSIIKHLWLLFQMIPWCFMFALLPPFLSNNAMLRQRLHFREIPEAMWKTGFVWQWSVNNFICKTSPLQKSQTILKCLALICWFT